MACTKTLSKSIHHLCMNSTSSTSVAMKKVNRWKGYLQADTSSITITDSPRVLTFSYPGFPYWANEHYASVPTINTIVAICEECFIFGSHNQDLAGEPKILQEMIKQGYLPFQTGIELRMSRDLYNPSISKGPLKVNFSHGFLTGPFITNKTEVMSMDGKRCLITQLDGWAYVEKKTRRPPSSLPAWFTSVVDGKHTMQSGLKIPRLTTRPDNCYKSKAMVLRSDIDSNQHANYKTYIAKCYDSFLQAVTLNEFVAQSHISVNIPWRIVKQGVKTLRGRFIKEALLGEDVRIHVWQEAEKPLWVFFSVEREKPEKDVIFEMALEYFTPSSSL